jgi:hypothetical protein
MGMETYLESRLEELERQRSELTAAVHIVVEKLKKADVKRAQEMGTEHFRKWCDILQTLEGQLNDGRNRLAATEAEIHGKTLKLAELREKARLETERKAEIIERIKTMSIEELGNLTAEELVVLQEYESSHGAITEGGIAAGGETEIESQAATSAIEPPASSDAEPRTPNDLTAPPQSADSSEEEEADSARRRENEQARLVQALRCVSGGNIRGLTIEEADLLVAFCVGLRKSHTSEATTARYTKMVLNAMDAMDVEWTRLRARCEQLGS